MPILQYPQPRGRLANLFWGDRPEKKHGSLSTSLWHIRLCLPGEGLVMSDLTWCSLWL
jgi:DNA-binding SARP family transcriptional activator